MIGNFPRSGNPNKVVPCGGSSSPRHPDFKPTHYFSHARSNPKAWGTDQTAYSYWMRSLRHEEYVVGVDDALVPIHSHPDKFVVSLVFQTARPTNIHEMPTCTWYIIDEDSGLTYYAWTLDTPVPVNPSAEELSKNPGRKYSQAHNLYQQVTSDIGYGYNLTRVDEVPNPDGITTMAELYITNELWNLNALRWWQKCHSMGIRLYTWDFFSAGGSANSPEQQEKRGGVSEARVLKSRFTWLCVAAWDLAGRTTVEIAEYRGVSQRQVQRDLNKARENLPQLTKADCSAAIEWARNSGQEIPDELSLFLKHSSTMDVA